MSLRENNTRNIWKIIILSYFQANNTAMIDDQLLQQAIELATSRDQLQRRNERERNRVNRVNIAFENLRSKLCISALEGCLVSLQHFLLI